MNKSSEQPAIRDTTTIERYGLDEQQAGDFVRRRLPSTMNGRWTDVKDVYAWFISLAHWTQQ